MLTSSMRVLGTLLAVCLAGISSLCSPALAQRPAGAPFRVGVILDGPSPMSDSVRVAFETEIATFFAEGPGVRFPAEFRVAGDWTARGAAQAIDRLLADKAVDLVLALGPIGSNELAHRLTLSKPGVAALIVDARAQNLPSANGASGVHNLTYIDVAYSSSRTLEMFSQVLSYHRLALLVHPGIPAAIPQLPARIREQATALGATLEIVPVTTSASAALEALPPDADAVYLGPLDQLPPAAVDSLIQGLNSRKLPTLSAVGRLDVARGVLASYAPEDDLTRRARRVAGNIQRIMGGEDAGTLPVALVSVARLTLNMATARAIGFSPNWATLTEADLLHEEAPATGPTWTLSTVGREAVAANLDLRAADRGVASGEQETRISRAALLPQIQAVATGTMIREATASASLGQQAERQTEATLQFSQSIYDDGIWANYHISRFTQEGRIADRRRTELDVVLRATTAYLSVLETKAIARVERENLALTRSNLDVAQLKEQSGAAGLSDVYRWQAELAQSRRRVLDADAKVRVAALELNSALNRPLEESFSTADAGIEDPTLLISQPQLLRYLDNPVTFAVFRDFIVGEAMAASPELRAIDAQILAEMRAGTSAHRSFFLPTLTFSGGLNSVLSRGGAGATPPSFGGLSISRAPDETWSLKLQASLPLFTGLKREASVARANIEVDHLTLARQATALSISQQVRGALQVASASWANIAQARQAAEASRKNLELVADAYGRGAVNVITLLDAQQSALSANEAAANAVYGFLIDLMKVQRASGAFDFFYSQEERESFFRRLDEFYHAAGLTPIQH